MKPIKYGASWKSIAALGAGSYVEVVPPAVNQRGMCVIGASCIGIGSGAVYVNATLLAKESAPTGFIDGDVLASAGYAGPGSISVSVMDKAVFVPPGKGLYWAVRGGEASNDVLRTVLYSLL